MTRLSCSPRLAIASLYFISSISHCHTLPSPLSLFGPIPLVTARSPAHAGHAQTGEPFEIAPQDAHKRLDRKDERTHANALADAEKTAAVERAVEEKKKELQENPTLAAEMHGNKPSRGAVKDKEIIEDEKELLEKKEMAKEQSQEAHAPKKH